MAFKRLALAIRLTKFKIMTSHKKTDEESWEAYYDRLADHLLTPRFGTFWWVLEKLLMRNLKDEGVKYDYRSDREAHPLVSIMDESGSLGRGYVPFLYGSRTGSSRKHVSITGLTHSRGEDTTYFGVLLRPVKISSQDMLSRNEDVDKDILEGRNADRSNVWPNWDRLEATDDEKSRIEKWCKRWGIL